MSRTRRRPYPSDLSDAEWALLEPLLASPERRGRPRKWSARRIADAVFYLLRSGCAWRMLPREYPPWQTVYYHFRKWRRDGRLRQAHNRLRATVRESEGRDRDPCGAVLDSQVVRTTGVGGPERGFDGAKRLAGRKRHLLVDTGGLVLGVHVHAASLHDRDGGRELLADELQGKLPRLASSGQMPPTLAGFGSGSVRSEDGAWRCPATPIGNCGGTNLRRSLGVSGCCRAGGW